MTKIVDYIFNTSQKSILLKNNEKLNFKHVELIGRGTPDWNESYMQNFINLIDGIDNSKNNILTDEMRKNIQKLRVYEESNKTRVVSNMLRIKFQDVSNNPVKISFLDEYGDPINSINSFKIYRDVNGTLEVTDSNYLTKHDISEWLYIETSHDFENILFEFDNIPETKMLFQTPRSDVNDTLVVDNIFSNNVYKDEFNIDKSFSLYKFRYKINDFFIVSENVNNRIKKLESVDSIVKYVNEFKNYIIGLYQISEEQILKINSNSYKIDQQNNDFNAIDLRLKQIALDQEPFADVINAAINLRSSYDIIETPIDNILRDTSENKLRASSIIDKLRDNRDRAESYLELQIRNSTKNLDNYSAILEGITKNIPALQENENQLKIDVANKRTEFEGIKTQHQQFDYTTINTILNTLDTILQKIEYVKTIQTDTIVKDTSNILKYFLQTDDKTSDNYYDKLIKSNIFLNDNMPVIDQGKLDTLISDVSVSLTEVSNLLNEMSILDIKTNVLKSTTNDTVLLHNEVIGRVINFEKRIDVKNNQSQYYIDILAQNDLNKIKLLEIENNLNIDDIKSRLLISIENYQNSDDRYVNIKDILEKQSSDYIVSIQQEAAISYLKLQDVQNKIDIINSNINNIDSVSLESLDTKTQLLNSELTEIEKKVNNLNIISIKDKYENYTNILRKQEIQKSNLKYIIKSFYDFSSINNNYGYTQPLQDGRFEILKYTSDDKIVLNNDWKNAEILAVGGGGAGGDVYRGGGGGAGAVYYSNKGNIDTGIIKISVGKGGAGGNNDTTTLGRIPPKRGTDTIVESIIGQPIVCYGGGSGDVYGGTSEPRDGGSGGGAAYRGNGYGRSLVSGANFYGNDGNDVSSYNSSGGGGAGSRPKVPSNRALGGDGFACSITGSLEYYGAGGGGFLQSLRDFKGERSLGGGGMDHGISSIEYTQTELEMLDAIGYGSGGSGVDRATPGVDTYGSGSGSDGVVIFRRDTKTPEDPIFRYFDDKDPNTIITHDITDNNYNKNTRIYNIPANNSFNSIDMNLYTNSVETFFSMEFDINGTDYDIVVGDENATISQCVFSSSDLPDSSIVNTIGVLIDSDSQLLTWYINGEEVVGSSTNVYPSNLFFNFVNKSSTDMVTTFKHKDEYVYTYGKLTSGFVKLDCTGSSGNGIIFAIGFVEPNGNVVNMVADDVVNYKASTGTVQYAIDNAISGSGGRYVIFKVGDTMTIDLSGIELSEIYFGVYSTGYLNADSHFNISISKDNVNFVDIVDFGQELLPIMSTSSTFTTTDKSKWNLVYTF